MALFSPIVLTADVPLRMQSVIYSGKWLATMTRAEINPMSSICILATDAAAAARSGSRSPHTPSL